MINMKDGAYNGPDVLELYAEDVASISKLSPQEETELAEFIVAADFRNGRRNKHRNRSKR